MNRSANPAIVSVPRSVAFSPAGSAVVKEAAAFVGRHLDQKAVK